MNDKRELWLSVINTIEWCARYWTMGKDEETNVNWEVYVQNRLVAYNYDNDGCYITKYTSTGWFPENVRLEVKYCHENNSFKMTKKFI